MKPVFALIDCDNFFVSCERLFRPDLEGKPVVVLSSNDGCAISRSREAKALGIPMGAPAFKYRQIFKDHGIKQFSANFELYGDISERITRVLTEITPRTEVYSVDEAFLDLSELEIADYGRWGRSVRQRLLQEVGIPISMGISPSKTLSKLAAALAKQNPNHRGVLDLFSIDRAARERYLLETAVSDVWGIGWRLGPKVRAEGIQTALDLARMRPRLANQLMGVHGRQLVAELNGQSCHPLQAIGKVRQSSMHGRMFGEDTNQLAVVEAAIASLGARAAFRIRCEHLLARGAVVYLETNRHKPGYERISRFISFRTPTADTGQITGQLVRAVESIFSDKTMYHRANVLLHDLVSDRTMQADLLGEIDVPGSQAALSRMRALDALNSRYGKNTVRYAAEDLSQAWQPKRALRSPRYTSDWRELPVARIL